MSDRRQLIPVTGLLATLAVAVYMVVQLNAQGPALAGDYSAAAVAEVRTAQGEVVLRGQFAAGEEEDDEIERKAELTPVGTDADARGEAEIEIPKSSPATQEIEFSIAGVESGAVYSFVIDGREVATAAANERGRAEVELDASPR
jgi:hypothetical protein